MPFTLAHPAAVWPLKYLRPGVTIPLIIGSLTPDLASYVPNSQDLINSHSVRGTMMFDLPLGYVLLLLLLALRVPLAAPLWEPHRSFFLNELRQLIASRIWWLTAIPALLIGSWTHIAWDSFTHENHFMVRRLPILQHAVALDGDHPMHLYRLLQYGCSVLGVVFVIGWYLHALRSSNGPNETKPESRYVLLSLLIGSLSAGLINALYVAADMHSFYWFISVILTTAMPVFAGLYLVLGFALWWHTASHASK